LALLLIGAVDPLEGSLLILPGSVLAAIGAWVAPHRGRGVLTTAMVCVIVGVAILFGLSALGGVGGNTGRSMAWLWLVAPYPVGWLLALIGVLRALRDRPIATVAPL
jgi:hypothetical protein